jgi:hypothetical protein
MLGERDIRYDATGFASPTLVSARMLDMAIEEEQNRVAAGNPTPWPPPMREDWPSLEGVESNLDHLLNQRAALESQLDGVEIWGPETVLKAG